MHLIHYQIFISEYAKFIINLQENLNNTNALMKMGDFVMPSKKAQALPGPARSVNLLDHRATGQIKHSSETNDISSAQDRFDRAIIEYYASKSIESDPASLDAIAHNALRLEKIAQKILSMPAMTMRQVLEKLTVLDAELLSDLDCEAPVERRHIVAFAALKVDIVRLLADKKR